MPSAIFRLIVEFATGEYTDFCSDDEKEDMDEDEAEDYISESEAIEQFKIYRSAFGKYFKTEWNDIIAGFISSGFTAGDSFIYPDKSFELIVRELSFGKINQTIDLNK